MLVSLKWLRDYVDIDIDAQTFGDKMTMTGTKTETVEYYGQDISNVVVGKILKIEGHPDADKLVIAQVEVGKDQPVQCLFTISNHQHFWVKPSFLAIKCGKCFTFLSISNHNLFVSYLPHIKGMHRLTHL